MRGKHELPVGQRKGEVNTLKKFLSIALALLMVCVMLPVVALADDTSLPAPDANGVITLEKDVTLTSTWKITSNVTLDLNGKKLNIEIGSSGNAVEVNNNATLTVKDSAGNGEMALSKHGITLMDANMKLMSGTVSCTDVVMALVGDCNFTMTGGKLHGNGNSASCFNPGYWGTQVIDIRGGLVQCDSTCTAVIGCGSAFKETTLGVTVSGDTVFGYGNIDLINGTEQGGENRTVSIGIKGGTFIGRDHLDDVEPYISEDLVVLDDENIYVGATATSVVSNATSGTFTVVNGTDVNLTVKGGVTVKNGMTEGTVTVNGKTLEANEGYTAPTVIIISGDTTPAETPKTEDQKNPSTGANDFVGLAAAAAVVALLGSAVVLRKK